jgi:hypothetical protein
MWIKISKCIFEIWNDINSGVYLDKNVLLSQISSQKIVDVKIQPLIAII